MGIDRDAIGGGELFSVWTTTEPGYFLAEEIAAGRLRVETLVFEFHIPRSPAPLPIFESMVKAAHYAKERLGGNLVGDDLDDFHEEAAVVEIMRVVEELTAAGFRPGAHPTLRLFC